MMGHQCSSIPKIERRTKAHAILKEKYISKLKKSVFMTQNIRLDCLRGKLVVGDEELGEGTPNLPFHTDRQFSQSEILMMVAPEPYD